MIIQKGFNNSFELLPRNFFHFFQLIIKLLNIYQLPDLRNYKNPILNFNVTYPRKCILQVQISRTMLIHRLDEIFYHTYFDV